MRLVNPESWGAIQLCKRVYRGSRDDTCQACVWSHNLLRQNENLIKEQFFPIT